MIPAAGDSQQTWLTRPPVSCGEKGHFRENVPALLVDTVASCDMGNLNMFSDLTLNT